MKNSYKLPVLCILIPLVTGSLSALITQNDMEAFSLLNQPPLSPPAILFPIVWTILYILMGISSYLVIKAKADKEKKKTALAYYGLQLVFNFFWSIWFFSFHWYFFAFVWLVALFFLILNTAVAFYGICKSAAYLLLPYLIWVLFAGYLNYAIFLLNR